MRIRRLGLFAAMTALILAWPLAASAKSVTKKTDPKAVAPRAAKATSVTPVSASKQKTPQTALKRSKKNQKQPPVAAAPAAPAAAAAPAAPAPIPLAAPAAFKHEAFPENLFVRAKAAMLMDLGSGEILYSLNPDTPIPPASITKVMTLYLIHEAVNQQKISPGEMIPVSWQASHSGGSRMNLRTGETTALSELVKGIGVVSANDACVAVAEYFGQGDPQAFVDRMNAKAKLLGMNQSVFKNANGLPAPGQVSTARDILVLSTDYLRRFPEALQIHALPNYTHNNRTHSNSNTLVGKYEGVDGLKTGFICESGYNIVATAKRGDTRLLAVVLGSPTKGVRERETAKLLQRGFAKVAENKANAKNLLAFSVKHSTHSTHSTQTH